MKNEKSDFIQQKNNSGALLNFNMKALQAYKKNRERILNPQQEIEEINKLKEELNTVKNELSDIKTLLIKALESK